MGIHGFYYGWLKNQGFPRVLQDQLPGDVCSLLIDMNGIIHRTSHIIYATDAIEEDEREKRGERKQYRGPRHKRNTAEEEEKKRKMKKRMAKLQNDAAQAWSEGETVFNNWLLELENKHFRTITSELLNLLIETGVNPMDLLIVSIDGPAPVAKMKQQRSRRFRSGQRRESTTLNNQGGYPWPLFDSNSITPGTDFMFRLDAYLQKWFKEQTLDLPSKVIYYSHMVPGEGEHRIMDDIRNGTVKSCESFEGVHVIYGSDADLAMLALIAPLDHLYIARDDKTDVINIDKFREAIFDIMKTKTALNDFVILFFLMGNDFLPRPPAMENQMEESINSLIEIYHEVNGVTDIPLGSEPVDGKYPLTNQDQHHTVNWDNMSVFLNMMGLVEDQLLSRIAARLKRPKFPSAMITESTITTRGAPLPGSRPKVTKTIDYNRFRQLWYSNALLPKTPYRIMSPLDQKLLGSPAITIEELDRMVLSYLQGIGWINTYYNQGTNHISLWWFYSGEYAPLFTDIKRVINQIGTTTSLATKIHPYVRQPNQGHYNVIYQLLSILSRASQNLLPIEVRWLMNSNSPISDLYPSTFLVEINGKNAEWQGIALLPPFQPSRVVKTVNNNIKFPTSRQRQFQSVGPLILEKSKGLQALIRSKTQFDRPRRGRGRGRGRGRREFRGRGRGRGRGRREFRSRDDRGFRREFRGRDDRGFRREFRGRDDRGFRREFRGRGRDDRGLRRQPPVTEFVPQYVQPDISPAPISISPGMVPQPAKMAASRLGLVGRPVSTRSFASALMEDLPVVTTIKPQSPSIVTTPLTSEPRPPDISVISAPNLTILDQPVRTRTERRLSAHHQQTPPPTSLSIQPSAITRTPQPSREFPTQRRRYVPRKEQEKKIQAWNQQEPLM